ncbi:hypothetical protein J437_LFUL003777 [Ladona fulva]|uniref:Uncharacterized protein n=1 Tax=Ladona fulva TaxID=123851 RepID=A0A8K0JU02_LADFU|nr:hypothetical protein J437_LFUL003777 [Ladona fulva]
MIAEFEELIQVDGVWKHWTRSPSAYLGSPVFSFNAAENSRVGVGGGDARAVGLAGGKTDDGEEDGLKEGRNGRGREEEDLRGCTPL